MKKGLILINAYMKSDAQFSQAARMKAELEGLGVQIDVKRNDGFFATVSGNEIYTELKKTYDFCLYLDKDKYVSEMLEKAGLRLFNTHEAIRLCDDKMQTHIFLAGKGVPMPDTLPGLLCYEKTAKIAAATVDRVEETLGYPLIVKECFGSLGKGVYLVEDRDELVAVMKKLQAVPHLFQRAVESSFGRDVRVIVIGGKVRAAMLRQSESDFRSNIELGGVGSEYEPSFEMQAVCERAARELGLDYCGIDVLFGKNGRPLMCESVIRTVIGRAGARGPSFAATFKSANSGRYFDTSMPQPKPASIIGASIRAFSSTVLVRMPVTA